EEIDYCLGHHAAYAVHSGQFLPGGIAGIALASRSNGFFPRPAERGEGQEMPGTALRIGLANMADAEGIEKARERDSAAVLDGGKKLPHRDFAETVNVLQSGERVRLPRL